MEKDIGRKGWNGTARCALSRRDVSEFGRTEAKIGAASASKFTIERSHISMHSKTSVMVNKISGNALRDTKKK